MKHDKFVIAPDRVPASFVRSLAICMLLGSTLWALVILAIV